MPAGPMSLPVRPPLLPWSLQPWPLFLSTPRPLLNYQPSMGNHGSSIGVSFFNECPTGSAEQSPRDCIVFPSLALAFFCNCPPPCRCYLCSCQDFSHCHRYLLLQEKGRSSRCVGSVAGESILNPHQRLVHHHPSPALPSGGAFDPLAPLQAEDQAALSEGIFPLRLLLLVWCPPPARILLVGCCFYST